MNEIPEQCKMALFMENGKRASCFLVRNFSNSRILRLKRDSPQIIPIHPKRLKKDLGQKWFWLGLPDVSCVFLISIPWQSQVAEDDGQTGYPSLHLTEFFSCALLIRKEIPHINWDL